MVLVDDIDKQAAELNRFANAPALARRRPSTETLPPYYRVDDDDLSSESSVSATTTNLLIPAARPPISPPLTPVPSPHPPLHISQSIQELSRETPPSPGGAPIAPKQPVNYMTVSGNNGSIRGIYHINPALTIPNAPPPSEGKIRPNLFLKCTNGLIKVEVRVLPPPRHSPKLPRCMIKLDATNGSISARIPNPGHAINIHLTISNGSAHLRLPRSFTGPLITTLRTSAMGASSSLASRLTVLSDPGMSTSRTRHAFVGDYRGANWTRVSKSWTGDEVVLEGTNASVKISYVDDPEDVKLVGSGQWNSILGSVM